MQNFPKDFFAYKSISVIDPFEKISDIKIASSGLIPDSLIFYPEGGHLVAGIVARLGIRAVGKSGNPVKIEGVLTNEMNDTLSFVRTGNNGYGMVTFYPPDSGAIYLASASKARPWKFPLPSIQKEGVILSAVKQSKDSRAIVRIRFSKNYNPRDRKIYLEIRSPGLAGSRKTMLPSDKRVIDMAADDIPFGISHITVADERGKILTERWISRETSKLLNIKISRDKNSYPSREKIRLDISATDNAGNPVESDLSISVAKSVTAEKEIKTGRNFRQLPGMAPVLEDCDFNDDNDYLIFFRPGFAESANSQDPYIAATDHLPEIPGHLIRGTISDRISGQPLSNENIILSFVGKTARCLFTKTDMNGNFNFVTKEKGLQEIVIQPLTYSSEAYVDLANPFQSNFINYDHGIFSIDTSRLEEINNVLVSMQIGEIYLPYYQQMRSKPAKPESENFYGKPDNTISMADYIELKSVREIVTELIPGVATTRNNGVINFRVHRPYQTQPYETGPLVLVDGVPVKDLDKVIEISASDIDKVDVLLERYFIKGNAVDGIIHFITKKGNLTAMEPDKSVFRMEYDLLQQQEDFYSPDYSADSVRNNHLPDFRNTLYWNPGLHTDAGGKVSVDFYSSDESVPYIIKVEGVSKNGIRGYASLPLVIK